VKNDVFAEVGSKKMLTENIERVDEHRSYALDEPINWSRLARMRSLLGVSLCERMKQVSYGKQSKTEKSTPEIEVMANTVSKPPMHPGKQMKCFGDMRKNDHHKTSCAQELQERTHSLSPKEQGYRTKKQHARWNQRDQCFQ
jgi:hypothetical protein